MLLDIWNELFYRPLFNFLIWMYNNWTSQNMGWAIVYLTVFLRIALLPFTISAERGKLKNKELVDELKRIEKGYKKDPILKNQEIRRALKNKKIRPWSSAISLSIQLLVLVLLYQVFMSGLAGKQVEILKLLYDFVDFPGRINTLWYGFELEEPHSIVAGMAVMAFMMVYIYSEYHKFKVKLTKGDLAYFLLFPLGTFIVLYYLPMVKSLFIFVSLAFSAIVHIIVSLMFKPSEEKS